MSGDDAVILMGKAPIPGTVKTRLCPPLSPRDAAGFYACLLEDAATEIASLRGAGKYLYYSPPRGKRFFRDPSFSPFVLKPQEGKDLGGRMARAFDETFAEGAGRAVIVGADCPALSGGRIRSAFAELRGGADAVFGPAEDGGFYLAGLSTPAPGLFEGIAWSTPAVLTAILSRCRKEGLTYALLPAESDVDTAEDLLALGRWTRRRSRPLCPRTRDWLASRKLPDLIAGLSSSRREERASSPSPGRRFRSAG